MALGTQNDQLRGPTVASGGAPQGQQQQNPLADYFANMQPEKLIAELKQRAENQWTALNARGVPNLYRLSYAQAFGMDPASGRNSAQKLEFCGPKANSVRFRVNLTRGLMKQRKQLAVGARVAFRAVAVNNDAATLAQVPIAQKGVTYVFREAKGETAANAALDSDSYFGEGFVWCRWDADGGSPMQVQEQVPLTDPQGQPIPDPNTGQPVMQTRTVTKRSGAPVYEDKYPWEVVRDQSTRRPEWYRIAEKASKYELIARYPQAAERLKGLSLKRDAEPGSTEMFFWDMSSATDDVVLVYHFYHRPCAAVPGGRYMGYVEDIPLWDEGCPVDDGMPVVSFCSARYFGTPIGYPEATDTFSQQEMLDELLSQWASNVLKFGNQSLWGEDGVEFDEQKFAEGGAYFTLKPGQEPPKVVEWNSVPEGTKYLVERLPMFMRDTSGINSVVNGDPDSNIKSGVFASLMQDIATKFMGSTVQTYDDGITDLGNITLQLIRKNASMGFLVKLAGESNAAYMQTFTNKELEGVHSVYMERQSPAVNNLAGRFEVFEKTVMLPPPFRRKAMELLLTGDITSWIESDESCIVLIRHEDEQMNKGQVPQVSATDDDMAHVVSHRASLDRWRAQPPPQNPMDAQMQAMAIQAHDGHISQHMQSFMMKDPVLAQLCQVPSAASMGIGGGMPPPPGVPPLPPKPGSQPSANQAPQAGRPAIAPPKPQSTGPTQ